MNRVVTMVLLGLASSVAAAADLGRFDDWLAETHQEAGTPVCSMWTTPVRQEGDHDERGSAFLFLTHKPAAKRVDEVFIETGYEYRKGSEVEAAIGGYRFTLLTSGSTAWTTGAADQRRLVAAMRAGAEMVVEGVSQRGTETRDVYSLVGFTAARKAISRACGVE